MGLEKRVRKLLFYFKYCKKDLRVRKENRKRAPYLLAFLTLHSLVKTVNNFIHTSVSSSPIYKQLYLLY